MSARSSRRVTAAAVVALAVVSGAAVLRSSVRGLRARWAEKDAPRWAVWLMRESRSLAGVRQFWQAVEGPGLAVSRDRRGDEPAAAADFQIYRNLHSYPKTDLRAVVESVDQTAPRWRREDVTFQAAYGEERVRAHLFLPKGVPPPYTAVAFFGGVEVLTARTVEALGTSDFDFIVASGRAVMVPAYQGTLERGPAEYYHLTGQPTRWRDMNLAWSKDLGRSLDYLETRPDIDMRRLAFYGVSLGAAMGPRLVAVEPRFRAAVLVSGGSFERVPAEVDAWNFAPHVRIPVLMMNGREDPRFPMETSQVPLYRRLGTAENEKRHVVLEGGHLMPADHPEIRRQVIEWLDRYLGPAPVRR